MQVVDLAPVPEFDATPFVTYQTEEFTTPTEAELVETLPNMPVFEATTEKPLRRGKGYLRAEISENEETASVEEQEDFGVGVEDEPAGATVEVPDSETPESESVTAAESEPAVEDHESQESQEAAPGKKRRRRRRRRGRGDRPEDDSKDGPSKQLTAGNSEMENGSQAASESEATDDSDLAEDKPTRRRKRRRNRRRRGKGKPAGSDGSTRGDNATNHQDAGSPSDGSES